MDEQLCINFTFDVVTKMEALLMFVEFSSITLLKSSAVLSIVVPVQVKIMKCSIVW